MELDNECENGILDMDLYEYLPEIVEIYTEILGEQYRSIIEQRVYNAKYVYYRTYHGVYEYYAFLRQCKSKKLAIKFLRDIGIEFDEKKEGSYAEPYSEETNELLLNLLGSSFTRIGFMDEKYSLSGIKSFDRSRIIEETDDYYERISQIRIINFFRGSEEIDDYNYDEFKKTQEFRELKAKIEAYYEVYKKALNEYLDYLKKINFYCEYARTEAKRRRIIAEKYGNDWCNNADEIEDEEVKTSDDYIRNVNMLGDSRNAEKMKIAFANRKVIVQELIGTFNPVLFFTVRSYDDGGRIDYMFLHEMFHIIGTSIRTKKQKEAEEDDLRIDKIENEIRRDLLSGNRVKSGLDCLSDFKLNPYNKQFRKYERLNETITDIFAMEARKRLHSRGIYLFEDSDISIEDISDANTSSRLKKMVAPLIKTYGEEVKEPVIGDDTEPLIAKIGIENFEEINDCVNIVDALLMGYMHREYDDKEIEEAIRVQEKRCKDVFMRINKRRRVNKNEER